MQYRSRESMEAAKKSVARHSSTGSWQGPGLRIRNVGPQSIQGESQRELEINEAGTAKRLRFATQISRRRGLSTGLDSEDGRVQTTTYRDCTQSRAESLARMRTSTEP